MKVSIVIPVLNERESLPLTVASIASAGDAGETIVVDGGSNDGTYEWLQSRWELRAFKADPGKGIQLNVGALAATGEVLIFLHADAQLPPNAIDQVRAAMFDKSVVGGCFCIQFPGADRSSRSLSIIAKGINFRTRLTRTATGDQAIFIRRSVFENLGGYKEWPLFEDVDLVTRMKRKGSFRVIASRVTLSPRRYLHWGPWRTTLLIYFLRIGYWLGVSPFRLKRWFDDIRPHLQRPTAAKSVSAGSQQR